MRFSKYNHEGYRDPTVYEAFTGIEEERKQEKQAVKQLRASYAVYRPIVYICSPYAGDVKQNVRHKKKTKNIISEEFVIFFSETLANLVKNVIIVYKVLNF